MNKTKTSIIGACGEHFVAAYLSGLDFIVALPRGGVPSCDLLVTTDLIKKSASIQVKTGRNPLNKPKNDAPYYAWDTSEKAIRLVDESYWYAFVNLNEWPEKDTKPEIFLIPSNIVATTVKNEHEKGAKRLFFWIYCSEAEQYKGINGVNRLRKILA